MSIAKKIALVAWGSKTLMKYGWPRALAHFAAGVGDELMLAAVIRELRLRGWPRFWVMSRRPELYLHNPDIAAVLPVDPRVIALARRCGAKVIEPSYSVTTSDENQHPPPAHILACMMASAGVTGAVALRPVIELTRAEQNAAKKWSGSLVIQATVQSAARPNELKEWWPDRWQRVVDQLKSAHRVVQIGGKSDYLLDGAEDLRGHEISLREIAALLSQARLFIGLESGFMHLARAVHCPAVILFGGHSHPDQTGYPGFTSLFRSPACAPCWRYHGCGLDRQCMRDITTENVIVAINDALQQPRATLPVSVVEISELERQRILAELAKAKPPLAAR